MDRYTLAALQDRRSQALEDNDLQAYWAFDLLIAHLLGTVDLYLRNNTAVRVYREQEAAR